MDPDELTHLLYKIHVLVYENMTRKACLHAMLFVSLTCSQNETFNCLKHGFLF